MEVKLGSFVEISYLIDGQAKLGIMEVVELFEDTQVFITIGCFT